MACPGHAMASVPPILVGRMSWDKTISPSPEAEIAVQPPLAVPGELATQILDQLPDPLLVLDRELRIRWQRTPRNDEDIPPCLDCDPAGAPRCSDCGARRTLETGQAGRQDHTDPQTGRTWRLDHRPLPDKDGAVNSVLIIMRPRQEASGSVEELETRLRQAGEENEQLLHAVAQAQSMTMETEAAHESMAHFLANMSHEIRTPMNGVLGMTEILLGTELTGEQRDYLETSYNSAESLLGIINDILDFSKIEAGKLELEEIPFDLGLTLEEAGDMLAFKAHEKNLEFLVNVDPDLPVQVLGDPTRIRQAVTNLAGNAIKFTSEGEIEVSVRREGGDATAGMFRVQVRDTGIGIPARAQEKLFQPFTQAQGSTTRQFGGTGLGLSICRKLAELMDGEVGVESDEGRGSTFWFTCILNLPDESQGESRVVDLQQRPVHILVGNPNLGRHLGDLVSRWQGKPVLGSLEQGPVAGSAQEPAPPPPPLVLFDESAAAQVVRLDRERPGAFRLVLLERLGEQPDLPEELEARLAGRTSRPLKRNVLGELLQGVAQHQAPPAASAGARKTPLDEVPELGHLRVLIAEDNLVNQKVARSFLKKMGITQQAMVENGKLALEALAREDFDLVLMDIQMPVMDGTQAMQHIRAGQEGVRRTDIPIIALTANALVGDREKYLKAGADGYLSKPLKARALIEALRELGLAEASAD